MTALLNERREWLLTAVGMAAVARDEAWQALATWWTGDHHNGSMTTLVGWFSNAADLLSSALLRFDGSDVDLVQRVERYVSAIYGHFNREGELPSRQQLFDLANAAGTD